VVTKSSQFSSRHFENCCYNKYIGYNYCKFIEKIRKTYMSEKKLDSKEKRTIVYMISLISQVGISMIVPIFLCVWIGIKISEYAQAPIIVLVAILIGCIVAFRNAYILLKQTYAKDLQRENEEQQYFKELEEARKRNMEKKDS